MIWSIALIVIAAVLGAASYMTWPAKPKKIKKQSKKYATHRVGEVEKVDKYYHPSPIVNVYPARWEMAIDQRRQETRPIKLQVAIMNFKASLSARREQVVKSIKEKKAELEAESNYGWLSQFQY